MEGNIQSRYRVPPQLHLQGPRGAAGIEEEISKIIPRTKRQGFLRTEAETVSVTGPGAGNVPRTGGEDQGRALGDQLLLCKDGADLGRKSPKGIKPGS